MCVLAVAAASACTLVTDLDGLHSDADASADAPEDVRDGADADAAAPRSDPATPFTPIGGVAGLASPTADEVMVRRTPNELEAYVQYGSTADGGTPALLHLDRADTTKPFANAASLGPLQPLPFGVTSDGLELVTAANLAYDWTRSSTGTNFAGGAVIHFGGDAGSVVYQPTIVGGGSHMLHGEEYLDGSFVLSRSERSDAGWGTFAEVGLANDTASNVLFPVLRRRTGHLLFAGRRRGGRRES